MIPIQSNSIDSKARLTIADALSRNFPSFEFAFLHHRRNGFIYHRPDRLVDASRTRLFSCYDHPALLLITFVSGPVWGGIYLRWPSIWGISLSHSLLGALAMFLGVL